MQSEVQPKELRDWLEQFHSSGFNREERDKVIAKMQSIGSEKLFPILSSFLSDPDSEFRCLVSEMIFRIDPKTGVDLLLPLLADPEWVVRVEICGLLHDIADKRTSQALIQIMKSDPNPMARNTAAYALGGIGDPVAIPALIEALDNDHETDELGHTASECAATALDNILKANHTRIKNADGLCTMQPWILDLNLLKNEAMEFFRQASLTKRD